MTGKYGSHVIDRLVAKTLNDTASDLLGSPDHRVIARLAAEEIREGIRLRKSRGQSVEGQLADVDRMGRSALETLCLERVRACVS